MKILFAMNQLAGFAGGSLVPVEVAEYLVSLGHQCTMAAHYLDDPLKRMVEDQNIDVADDVSSLNAFEFDLVWLQNQTAPMLRYEITESARPRTLFAFVHLSSQRGLASPGILFQPLLADWTIANSAETKSHLVDLGISENQVSVFPNPAPSAFWQGRNEEQARGPKMVRLVSNHAPPEAIEALQAIEKRGLRTHIVGRAGLFRRVTPDFITKRSAIISIGKTVQYAIARGVPVYVYDRYGGPGYLSEENFEKAAAANFSGRCCNRVVSAETIADEIVSGFPAAAAFVANLPESVLSRYRLEPYVDRLLDSIESARPNVERRAALDLKGPMLRREQALAFAIRDNFRGHMIRNVKIRKLRRALQHYKKPLAAE